MASIKISELEEVTTLSGDDVLPMINEGDTKQVSVNKLGDVLATREYVDTLLDELTANMEPSVAEYMRISDYLQYPIHINEDNYAQTEIAKCKELINFYMEMEDTNGE